MWTTWVRERAVGALPPEKLLPDRQPAYVSSWIYVFGVATIAALVVVVASGMILGLKGPEWWHVTSLGRFFNGIHLWAVELFFFAMVVHLWGKFFMGAWRGGRGRTWVTGAITFLVAIGAAFTGYLSQQNFDSQWIASEGKDGLNSVGIGAFFNVADFGQMYTFHVILLPLAVVALVVWHVLLVRRHGVVPPYPAKAAKPAAPLAARRRRVRAARRERADAAPAPRRRRALAGPVRPLRPGQGARRRAGRDHGAGGRSSPSSSPPPTTRRRRSRAGRRPTPATSSPPRSPS